MPNSIFSSLQEGYAQVFKALQQQALTQASDLANQLIICYPRAAAAYIALAAAASEQGDLVLAEKAMQKTLTLEPNNGSHLFNLLQLLQGQGKAEAMIQICRNLPDPKTMVSINGDLCLKIADVLLQAEDTETRQTHCAWLTLSLQLYPNDKQNLTFREPAFYLSPQIIERFFAEAKVQLPVQVEHWRRAYIQLSFQRKAFEDAIPFLAASLKTAADFAPIVYKSLKTLWEDNRFWIAQPYFKALAPYLEHSPLCAHQFYRDWAVCAHRNNDLETFEICFTEAQRLAPHPLYYAIDKMVQFPRVYESEAHIQALRSEFQTRLNHLEAKIDAYLSQGQKPVIQLSYPFGLAYQGLNDLELVSQLGRIGHKALHGSERLQKTAHAPQRKAPFKVGFISHYFYEHSVLRAYGVSIAQLAKDPEFETYVMHTGSVIDHRTHELAHEVDHFAGETDPQKILEQLRTWELDALIYTDVGMDWLSYFLAQHRVAPIQGILSGHPVTSGIPHMDYFFTNQSEAYDIQARYSEKVVVLTGSFSPSAPAQSPPKVSRALFAQSHENTHIYFCPMLLFKIHPSFDTALKGILERDDCAQIYFVDIPKDPATSEGLKKRFAQTVGSPLCERIFFMPWMGKEDFRNAIASADVMLDTFCFGSGTTTVQILDLHQLLVTLPGEFFRARIARIFYVKLDMMEHTVAQSVDDYVHKAVRIACDKDHRNRLRQELAKKQSLYRQNARSKPVNLKTELKHLFETYPR